MKANFVATAMAAFARTRELVLFVVQPARTLVQVASPDETYLLLGVRTTNDGVRIASCPWTARASNKPLGCFPWAKIRDACSPTDGGAIAQVPWSEAPAVLMTNSIAHSAVHKRCFQ